MKDVSFQALCSEHQWKTSDAFVFQFSFIFPCVVNQEGITQGAKRAIRTTIDSLRVCFPEFGNQRSFWKLCKDPLLRGRNWSIHKWLMQRNPVMLFSFLSWAGVCCIHWLSFPLLDGNRFFIPGVTAWRVTIIQVVCESGKVIWIKQK